MKNLAVQIKVALLGPQKWIYGNMRKRDKILKFATIVTILITATFLAGNRARADGPKDILVVANKSVGVDQVDADVLRAIFLKKRKSWKNGGKVVPVNAKKGTALRQQFLSRLFNMIEEEEKTYWEKQKISKGVEPPPEFSNNLKAVFHLKGGITYVYRSEFPEGVAKILYVLPQ